jgi:phosphate uptake regulator
MTPRRHQVLRYLADKAKRREQIALRQLVRECDLHDNSSALRIIRDLKSMGALV